ncbi:MAG: CDP-alcohol phosphatidyltransferase family protein [Candidatus Zixiibacteriota bacterium]|nr:MAG: CDP-alcohol phosphatidyltransferase family protein [candidate division Zixibacteria bacterium]
MSFPTILRIPNLLSLFRVALVPVIAYCLWLDDPTATLVAVILLASAGISDGLDGYLARRWDQVSKLGIALDPIADKIMAGSLVILLIIFRDFPIWLAVVIIGRDLLILGLGLVLLSGERIVVPSNLTGKYAFSAIAILLISYVIRHEFGIMITTWVTLPLIVASLGNYGHVFMRIRSGRTAPQFKDRPLFLGLRVAATSLFSAIYLIKLYLDILK